MFPSPLHHSAQCTEKFFASNSYQNLYAIFHHIYKMHSSDREIIKHDYNQWYIKLKVRFH
jgi:hypothetical protein